MSDFLHFNNSSAHTTGQKVAFVAPVAMTLVAVTDFRTNAAGTTGATLFDIEINGTSALSAQVSVASGAVVPASLPTFTSTAVAAGDVITIDCDQIASTAGSGFNAVITYVKGTEKGRSRAGSTFVVNGVDSGHDHRFGQPANDRDDYHTPELGH